MHNVLLMKINNFARHLVGLSEFLQTQNECPARVIAMNNLYEALAASNHQPTSAVRNTGGRGKEPVTQDQESEDGRGGHWKSRSKKKKSSGEEDDLSQPWVCEETDPFTPRIRYFDFLKTRMPSHIKTYDGRNARVWFDVLLPESIDSYDDLKKAFLENYLQQKKNKLESRDVNGASECMRISGFMHGITNSELIKRLHDKIPKTVDEMIEKPKAKFQKGDFRNQQWSERKQDRFSLLTKTPKEIFALDKGKFKAPPPMTTPVKKRNHAKFYEFHGEVGHNMDECMHLRKQIEEMLKAGKLSYLIKEIKQNNRNEQPKVTKKRETYEKDKALAILMVQPWERVARQRITSSFSLNPEIFFPPLREDEGTKGPMIIEAEIRGHCVHRMYEHCFSRLRSKIKKQLILATTPFIGFSSEIIWPIGQIQLLVKIEDEEHSDLAWMNFMVARSQSPYNGIIGRPRVRKLQAVSSIYHGMLKIPVERRVITLKSSKLVPLECAMVSRPGETLSAAKPIIEESVKKPADMTGVPRHIAKHRLNVREGCSLVRQKKRGQTADRNQAIQEVGKLVGAGIKREVHYHDWLSNPMMVKKHNGSWRMCVDFKDLNKACPKDDWKKSKSVRGRSRHTSRTKDEIVRDIEKTFKTLRETNMKIDPKKCAFGVEEGMFLGRKSDLHWTTKAEEAFKKMKQLIAELPMLTTPMEKEELIVYLAAAKETVSAVLMTKREAKQMPFYFVSRALIGPELNYTSMEKLVLSLVHASKRLKRPRVSVKGHILADSIVERPEEDSPDTLMHSCWRSFDCRTKDNGTNGCNLQANVDSRLVANQVNETYVAKEADMIRYLEKKKGKRRQQYVKPKVKQKWKKYYNSKVRNTSFKPGDLVYLNNDASREEDTRKLGPKWEGPYEVTKALGKGAYKLRDHDGK
uniref:Reverse transcriptase/retrotransposon-derived protein RNase H-like domain-containing protein n=1 Tax=Tanacetum cinerariifolium TaxID=118510 RepID=A0A6L2MTJ8_TANCI|nr:hypothetical protein [Tanacetum cinerariifolium]